MCVCVFFFQARDAGSSFQYCDSIESRGDATEEEPGLSCDFCSADDDPVCSLDGTQQFGNSCRAHCAGVLSFSRGICAAEYLGYDNKACLEFCFDDGSMPVCSKNTVEFPGSCSAHCFGIHSFKYGACPVDESIHAFNRCFCADSYSPVCAGGEKEYTNQCFAKCAGETAYTEGPCAAQFRTAASLACSEPSWIYDKSATLSTSGHTCPSFTPVVFTAIDDCGNQASVTSTFTIQDRTPPFVVNAGMPQTIESPGMATSYFYGNDFENWIGSNGGIVFSDAGLNGAVTVSHSQPDFQALRASGTCPSARADVIFTAQDDCGNKVSRIQTFIQQDTLSPVVIFEPQNLNIQSRDQSAVQRSLTAWLQSQGGSKVWDQDHHRYNPNCPAPSGHAREDTAGPFRQSCTFCNDDVSPVCGDGSDFVNSCHAKCHSAQLITNGPCSEDNHCADCDTDQNVVCKDGKQFFNPCYAQCSGAADYAHGTCRRAHTNPCFCNDLSAPVCANGKDYINNCHMACFDDAVAQASDITIGACETESRQDCGEGIAWSYYPSFHQILADLHSNKVVVACKSVRKVVFTATDACGNSVTTAGRVSVADTASHHT